MIFHLTWNCFFLRFLQHFPEVFLSLPINANQLFLFMFFHCKCQSNLSWKRQLAVICCCWKKIKSNFDDMMRHIFFHFLLNYVSIFLIRKFLSFWLFFSFLLSFQFFDYKERWQNECLQVEKKWHNVFSSSNSFEIRQPE